MLVFFRQLIGIAVLLVVSQGCTTNAKIDEAKAEIVVLEEIETASGKAEMAYQAGQFKKSLSLWKRVVELDPRNEKALYRMGNTNFRLGNVKLSRDFYEKTVEINPRHSKAHYNLAVISLVLAEQHFQFYTATTDPTTDLDSVTELMGEISRFKLAQNKPKQTRLERLSDQLSGKI